MKTTAAAARKGAYSAPPRRGGGVGGSRGAALWGAETEEDAAPRDRVLSQPPGALSGSYDWEGRGGRSGGQGGRRPEPETEEAGAETGAIDNALEERSLYRWHRPRRQRQRSSEDFRDGVPPPPRRRTRQRALFLTATSPYPSPSSSPESLKQGATQPPEQPVLVAPSAMVMAGTQLLIPPPAVAAAAIPLQPSPQPWRRRSSTRHSPPPTPPPPPPAVLPRR